MEIIYATITIFGLAAIVGMYLLSLILRTKSTPKAVSALHGLLAGTALILLIVYTLGNKPGPWPSVIIFTIAALGGLVLIYRDLTGKTIPKWLGITHGLTAILGFVLLILFAF